jgi:hypothetical protein
MTPVEPSMTLGSFEEFPGGKAHGVYPLYTPRLSERGRGHLQFLTYASDGVAKALSIFWVDARQPRRWPQRLLVDFRNTAIDWTVYGIP